MPRLRSGIYRAAVPEVSPETPAAGPLAGVRVLDVSSVIMGPYATQILSDMGAEVTCIESARGDTNRFMGPGPHPELSGIALNLLRGKRNLCLDLKRDEAREVVLRMVAVSDVMVTNLRPGSLRRLGLDYEQMAAVRPEIVYCEAHGFASDSPQADDAAYDDIVQAASGMADLMTRVTGEPYLVPSIFADKVCGLSIAYSICAALYARQVTGRGQHIEVPMVETMKAFVLAEHGAGAISVPPTGPVGYPRILTSARRSKCTADGWIHLMPYSAANWNDLFREAGRLDLVDHPVVNDIRLRHANSAWLYGLLEEILPLHTTEEWLGFCRARNIPATQVATLEEMTEELPEADHPVVGRYRAIPFPVRFSGGMPPVPRRPAPLLGQDNELVLRELGYSVKEIERLARTAVTQRPGQSATEGEPE